MGHSLDVHLHSITMSSLFATFLIKLHQCARAAPLHVLMRDHAVVTHRYGLINTMWVPWTLTDQPTVITFHLLNQLSHDDLQLLRITHIQWSLSSNMIELHWENKRRSQTTPPKQILINVWWIPAAQDHSNVNDIWRTRCHLKSRSILIWGSKVEMQLQGCTASSSICHHGKSDIWVWAAKGSLQLKPRSPRCNNVIKKDCWESFCFLTTQRFTYTKPWLMLGFARKECSWESRNFKLQLFFSVWNCLRSSLFKHEEKGTEICIMPPLSTPQKNINDLSEGGLGYVTNSDFLWMSQAKSLEEVQ